MRPKILRRVRGNAHASTGVLLGHERYGHVGVESVGKDASFGADCMASVLRRVLWGLSNEIPTTCPRSYGLLS